VIIFNTPIQPKFFHRAVASWLRDIFRKKNAMPDAKFNVVYFSYRPDFEYLVYSIKSLLKNTDQNDIRNIFIYIDQKDIFTKEQEASLSALSEKISFRAIYNFEWGSPKSTLSELECYLTLSKEIAAPNDFLVKVDSDIIFIKSKKLGKLLKSNLHAVGDSHFLGYKFIQGGMYMIRLGEIIKQFSSVTLNDIEKISKDIRSVGEDKVISTIFKKNGVEFNISRLMLFPDEYKRIKKRTILTRWEFCAMHFHQDKENMAKYFRNV